MSLRLKNFNYSRTGIYFITIVTKDRQHFFGEIRHKIMTLNDLGRIALRQWRHLPTDFPYIDIDEFIIMPNHIHGIVWIDKDLLKHFNTIDFLPSLKEGVGGVTGLKNPMLHHNLSRVIRSFKAKTSYYIHQAFPDREFAWQSSFYDSIITTKKQLMNTRNYIRANPENWREDDYY